MGTRAHIAAHEYVAGAFDDVLNALQTSSVIPGVDATGSRQRLSFARHGSRGTASLQVRIGDAEATLVILRITGGRQAPVTELLLTAASLGHGQLPASEARRFLEDLVPAVEGRLRAASRGRPRALIESRDLNGGYAIETMLRRAGYDTELCGGPEELPRHRCPLVATGVCALAERADVIIHALDLDRPHDAEVLRALRSHYPETPVVVQIPAAARQRHRELVRGCSVVENLMVRSSLLGAVETALERGRGSSSLERL